jgi:tRNA-Thr(GGU) m(6)t(6)A37 methyltransferase TsaA
MPQPSYSVTPIGVISTPYAEKPLAPRQPGLIENPPEGVITLFPGSNFEQALEDLEGFDRVWILSWFDRNEGWTPKVLPPRSGKERRGVFATRSPHRPNAIGLSLCRLLGVKGRTVRVEDPDLLDGTPILDLKPYLPYAEAFPESAAGWLDALEPEGEIAFDVATEPLALEQLTWLRTEHAIDLMARALPLLARYPHPHPSRRTKIHPDGGYILGVKSWRLRYAIDGARVVVRRVASGYGRAAVDAAGEQELHDQAAHRAFYARWPQE